jgi:hypothetical protein
MEFSTLRLAKYSTAVMLHMLQQGDVDFACNACNQRLSSTDVRYHCNSAECPDFDLCKKCYQTVPHSHPMEQMGFAIASDSDTSTLSEPERRQLQLTRAIEALAHSAGCPNPACEVPNCQRMKTAHAHFRQCRQRPPTGACPICKHLSMFIGFHSRSCTLQACTFPYCMEMRARVFQQQRQQQAAERQILARRMAVQMQHNSAAADGDDPAPSQANPEEHGGAPAEAPSTPSVTLNSSNALSSSMPVPPVALTTPSVAPAAAAAVVSNIVSAPTARAPLTPQQQQLYYSNMAPAQQQEFREATLRYQQLSQQTEALQAAFQRLAADHPDRARSQEKLQSLSKEILGLRQIRATIMASVQQAMAARTSSAMASAEAQQLLQEIRALPAEQRPAFVAALTPARKQLLAALQAARTLAAVLHEFLCLFISHYSWCCFFIYRDIRVPPTFVYILISSIVLFSM